MHKHLPNIKNGMDLHGFTNAQLDETAAEIRDVLCNLVATRAAHFASNLGVVELCLALHSIYER